MVFGEKKGCYAIKNMGGVRSFERLCKFYVEGDRFFSPLIIFSF